MSRALWISATGMMAQELNVDVISNNLANVNTPGFKKSRIEFKDLMYQNEKFAGASTTEANKRPIGLQIGLGSYPVATQRVYTEGDLVNTGGNLDIAINGQGFFQVQQADGTTAYTRDGAFKRSETGALVTAEGYLLEPNITIPPEATELHIGEDGTVTVVIPGQTQPQTIGQIQIARFSNPAGLEAQGNNLFKITPTSGDPLVGAPNSEGRGPLSQGFLEMSNVEIAEEMIRMIVAQRAYEINSKAIQASDNIMSIANSLKR